MSVGALLGLAAVGAFMDASKRKSSPSSARGERKSTSHRERSAEAGATRAAGELAELLLDALGVLYSYGAGDPSTSWPPRAKGIGGGLGIDCSGFAQAFLARVGWLPRTDPDRSAASLANWCESVKKGSQKAGDLAFYGRPITHVMVCLTDADDAGHSEVIGASGGRKTTNGDDPNARVKSFETEGYRGDFVCFGRSPYR